MTIYQIMEQFFRDKEFPASQVGTSSALSMTVAGSNGQWPCIAQAVEDQQIFLFYSSLPENIPAGQRQIADRLISALNYKLLIGNFEMASGDGDFRFRTSLDLTGIINQEPEPPALVPWMIERSVVFNITTMDRFLPLINAVASNEVSIDEALERADSID